VGSSETLVRVRVSDLLKVFVNSIASEMQCAA